MTHSKQFATRFIVTVSRTQETFVFEGQGAWAKANRRADELFRAAKLTTIRREQFRAGKWTPVIEDMKISVK